MLRLVHYGASINFSCEVGASEICHFNFDLLGAWILNRFHIKGVKMLPLPCLVLRFGFLILAELERGLFGSDGQRTSVVKLTKVTGANGH